MLDQQISQTNTYSFGTARLPTSLEHASLDPLTREDPDFTSFITNTILEVPRLTMISTVPTPDFEICPATPLNEAPEGPPISGHTFLRDSQLYQNHLEPRATHRARSSSISSLSSITSSTSSVEENWDAEPENTLIGMNITDIGINMDDFNLNSSQSVSGSPNMDSPQDQVLIDTYFANQNEFVLSQNGYLSPNTQLSRSSSLSSNISLGNHPESAPESLIRDDQYFQEFLSSQFLANRRSSMCSIGTASSFADPDLCTPRELADYQHIHARSYSLSTLDFSSFGSSFQYPTPEESSLNGEANYPKLDFTQEIFPTIREQALQLSQEELHFITFDSDLKSINNSTPCNQANDRMNPHSCPLNRPPTEYICNILGCSKIFRRKHSLLSHQRIHSEDKPFPCEFCRRPFARKHDMLRHRRMHTGQKPYPCEACGHGFYRTDARQRHYQAEPKCWEVVMKGKING